MSSGPAAVADGVASAAGDPQQWRERKKAMTWQALHRAAVRLADERGIAGVTTEEMAEAAQVSPRTFFNYFPTKEAAVLGVAPDQGERVVGWLAGRPADEPTHLAVRACLTSWALDFTADRELWATRRRIVRSDPGLQQAMGSIASAVETALTVAVADRMGVDVQSDLRPGVLVAAMLAAMRVGLGLSRERDVPVEDALDEAFGLLTGAGLWATGSV